MSADPYLAGIMARTDKTDEATPNPSTTVEAIMTPERANEIAFEWLSQHSRHAPHCKRVRDRIVPQEPRSGLCKDYGGRYATEEELAKIACTCGLDDVHKALCQAARK